MQIDFIKNGQLQVLLSKHWILVSPAGGSKEFMAKNVKYQTKKRQKKWPNLTKTLMFNVH